VLLKTIGDLRDCSRFPSQHKFVGRGATCWWCELADQGVDYFGVIQPGAGSVSQKVTVQVAAPPKAVPIAATPVPGPLAPVVRSPRGIMGIGFRSVVFGLTMGVALGLFRLLVGRVSLARGDARLDWIALQDLPNQHGLWLIIPMFALLCIVLLLGWVFLAEKLSGP
jgi:DNA-binding helix-hairpin-helix protein with protein kinase domain